MMTELTGTIVPADTNLGIIAALKPYHPIKIEAEGWGQLYRLGRVTSELFFFG